MRRALRKELPALSFHFGLRWEHVYSMPPGELEEYRDRLHEIQNGG